MLTEGELESGVVPRRGIEIVSGNGSHIWDSTGKRYLDMGASYGACNVGHCNPAVVEAVEKQLRSLIYISSSYDNPVRKGLMEKLISVSPEGMSRVFLCNSGTESIEAAIKFAVKTTGRKKLIAAKRSFHGRTLGSLSLTFNPTHRQGMEDLLIPVDFVTYGDPQELEGKINENTAAVVLEPVQGEGGVHVPPDGYLKRTRELCDENGTLLIIDEVQTGFCRTGRMFGIDHHEITPDIMCVGKSLGGGLPIAAAILKGDLKELPKGFHGSTFGGNPLVSAAAIASIGYMIDEELDKRSEALGKIFMDGLNDIGNQKIREVRGKGLMIGVELKERAGPYLSALLERGIAAIPTGTTVIRFLPPLIVNEDDIDNTIQTLSEVLDA